MRLAVLPHDGLLSARCEKEDRSNLPGRPRPAEAVGARCCALSGPAPFYTPGDRIEWAVAIGAEGIELCEAHLPDLDVLTIDDVATELQVANLPLSLLRGSLGPTSSTLDDTAEISSAVGKGISLIRTASRLGGPGAVCLLQVSTLSLAQQHGNALARLHVEALPTLALAAEAFQVVLAIDCFASQPQPSGSPSSEILRFSENLLDQIGRSGTLGLHFDPSSLIRAGDDPASWARRFADGIVSVHLGATAGRRTDHLESIARVVSEAGYNRWLGVGSGIDAPEDLKQLLFRLR